MAAGIQDITNAMVEEFKLSDVLRMILETMFRALDFHRIVFCMRESRSDMLTGRFGLGMGVEGVVKQFRVPMGKVSGPPDLFATICAWHQAGRHGEEQDVRQWRLIRRLHRRQRRRDSSIFCVRRSSIMSARCFSVRKIRPGR